MFSSISAKSRHPPLHTNQAKRHFHQPAATAVRHRRALLFGGGSLALLVTVLVLLYRLAPQQASEAASEEAERDRDRELQLLHEQPSLEFCALPAPLVCAHGGDIAAAPPNTAAAFQAALDGGARCLEVDVAQTYDGQLVVLHTRELAHLLHLAGNSGSHRRRGQGQVPPPQVGDFTWRELQVLRWEGGQGVELVEAVLRLAQHRTDQITLDVKTYSQAGDEVDEDAMAQAVLDLIRRTGCRQCLVWAKSDALVRQVKELDPLQAVGYVVLNETAAARAKGMHRLLRMATAEVVALHYAMAADVAVTAEVRRARKQVHAWTANTAGMMRSVLDAGVDAVVTNHPRKLQNAVDSRMRCCQQQQQQSPGWEQGQVPGEHQQRHCSRPLLQDPG